MERKIGPFGHGICEMKENRLACSLWKSAGDPEQALPTPDAEENFDRINFRLKSDPVIVWPDQKTVEFNAPNTICKIKDLPQGTWAFCTNDKEWIER